MHRVLLAALLSSVAFHGAHAADAIVYDPVAEVVPEGPAGFSWTGAYAGVQLGYGWGDSHYLEPEYSGYYADYDPKGIFGGVYVGYNQQLPNNLVLGIDADFAFADMTGHSLYYNEGVQIYQGRGDARVEWTAAVRARLGYAIDRFLPYVAAGAAFARYRYDMIDEDLWGFDAAHTRIGWTIGAGAEYAVTDRVTLRGEYRFSDYGSERVLDPVDWWTNDTDLKVHDIRIGIAYRF